MMVLIIINIDETRKINRNRSGLEDLHPVVFTIAHEYVSIGHDCDALESFEFSIAGTPRAKGSQEAAIWMENLYAIVA
jgi:hypothetical protein